MAFRGIHVWPSLFAICSEAYRLLNAMITYRSKPERIYLQQLQMKQNHYRLLQMELRCVSQLLGEFILKLFPDKNYKQLFIFKPLL